MALLADKLVLVRVGRGESMTKQPVEPSPKDGAPSGELQARFGTNFKEARRKMGLTQVQVAERAGMVQKSISELEKGNHNATLSTMERLAKAIDHSVSVLLRPVRKPPHRD